MKTKKFLSIAVLVGSIFIGQGLFAQEKKMMKKEELEDAIRIIEAVKADLEI
jgi:hypothetical protein